MLKNAKIFGSFKIMNYLCTVKQIKFRTWTNDNVKFG